MITYKEYNSKQGSKIKVELQLHLVVEIWSTQIH